MARKNDENSDGERLRRDGSVVECCLACGKKLNEKNAGELWLYCKTCEKENKTVADRAERAK